MRGWALVLAIGATLVSDVSDGFAQQSPEGASPEAVSPEAVSPEAVSPEAVSPEAVSPEAVSPEAVSPADRASPEESLATGALRWVSLDGCATAEVIARRVNEASGRDAAGVGQVADLVFEGGARREEDAWVARFRVVRRDGSVAGERVLRSNGPSCEAIDDALVLTLALALDLPRATVEAEARDRPSASGTPLRVPSRASDVAVVEGARSQDPPVVAGEVPRRAPPWEVGAAWRGGVVFGSFDTARAWTELGFVGAFGALALELSGSWARRARVSAVDGSADVRSGGLGFSACGRWARVDWAMLGCGRVSWLRTTADGQGFARSFDAKSDRMYGGAGFRLRHRLLGAWWLELAADLLGTRGRPTVVVREADGSRQVIARAAPVWGTLGIGFLLVTGRR